MDESKVGAALQGGAEDARKQAAALMGSARTERKMATMRTNLQKANEARRGGTLTEEHKAKIAATRKAQEEARKQAAPVVGKPEPKQRGRPRRETVETGEKRGRGRPKKQDAPQTAEAGSASGRGTQEAETA